MGQRMALNFCPDSPSSPPLQFPRNPATPSSVRSRSRLGAGPTLPHFFASRPGAFTPKVYEKAVGFAAAAHNALHLSVRIITAVNRAEDLEAAMHSRTAIDLACGVIMAQNRCSQAEAMKILSKVSSNRNRKLRDVAAELVERLSGHSIQTHFDA